jgi:uroporphyrinogen-III synthase
MTADPKPLVAVTRAEQADGRLSQALVSLGARTLPLPTVQIGPPQDSRPLTAALAEVALADWVIFTSGHAVDATCAHPGWQQARDRGVLRARIAAVGRATADRVRAHGLKVDVVPASGGGARDLADALSRLATLTGTRVLWPRSDIARRELPEALERLGASVADPPAYSARPVVPAALPEFIGELDAGRLGAVVFLSPSSAHGLARALPSGTLAILDGRTIVASLGPTTSAAISNLGAHVDIEDPERDVVALAAAIMRRLTSPGRQGAA